MYVYYFSDDGTLRYGDDYKHLANVTIELSEPEKREGYTPVPKYNPETQEGYWEYRELKPSPVEIIKNLQNLNKTADQKYKEVDLTTAALQEVKDAKMNQLDELCGQSIVAGFDYTLNDVSYRFSCSTEAQANFTGTDILFKDGLITQAEWTVVNNVSGEVARIILDQATFDSIKLQVFTHINSNISKLRNNLQPQVEVATTNEEVDAVVW